jgi:hypothetical protein
MQEFMHTILRQANQQMQDVELSFDGHIATYDVDSGKAKVIVPVKGIDDDGDNSSGGGQQAWETNWIPVAVPFIGFQYCFKGGATAENPAGGEAVLVIVQNRENGHIYCVPCNYNQSTATMNPPGAAPAQATANNTVSSDSNSHISDDDSGAGNDVDGSAQLQPGELIMKFPPAAGAPTFFKVYQDGSFRTNVQVTMDLRVVQELNVIVKQGDLNIDVQQGTANVNVEQGDVVVSVPNGDITMTAGNDINITAGQDLNLTANGGASP